MSVLCLVPDALRAARAARRLCDAEGGILFGARVTTLDALAPGILAAAGDGRALLSALAERLLALDAGAAAGGLLGALEPGSGLGLALASALAELRQGEVAPGEVRAAAAELGGRAGGRLAALADALEAYGARLALLGALDRPGAALAAAAALERHGASSAQGEVGALDLLVLEGFSALPPAAAALVSALARRARRTHARVPFFAERPDVSAPAEATVRRLEAMHELRDVAIALEDLDAGGARAPRLARLLGAVVGGSGGGRDGDDGLVLASAGAGEEGEADVAARLVAG
ncbi:MAG TPA: PD-(D/E)XK nuclease family protein, partial [Anaeromyxobacteraceae bacterium]